MSLSHHLTRRRFVCCLAAGGAATTILRPMCLRASGRRLPPLSFVVVSDTHLGYRDQDGAARQWLKTAAEIAQAPGDFVLHLGDIVDGGREPQYPVYLDSRRQIHKPVYEIPGNHDPQDLFAKHLRAEIDTVVDHQWLRLLLLNNSRTDSHDGFLSGEQIMWIERHCADAAKKSLFVAIGMHVPAHKNLHPDRGWYVKPENGQEEFYQTIARHQDRVLALMHGHFHNGIRGWNDHGPVHEIVFPSALYNRDRKLAEQKAAGYNLKEFRPGYTLLAIRGGELKLRYKPVDAADSLDKRLELAQLAT